MRAILSAPGSRGDVNPMVAIGRELKSLGFDVVISLAEPYVDVAEAAGLTAIPVVGSEEFAKLLANPAMWKPIRGVRRIFSDVAVPFLHRHYEVIEQYHLPDQTVLVAHPLDLASRVYHELHQGTPIASVHLAPAMLRDDVSPPRLTSWPMPTRPAWLVRSMFAVADHLVVDPIVRPAMKPYLASQGLSVPRRVLNNWWVSPDLILAMYPDWFAPTLVAQYPNLHAVGFPCEDLADSELPNAIANVDQFSGGKPIVFTAGTAHHHSRSFFETAVAACESLGRPGVLLTSHHDNLPASLPSNITSCRYVSLKRLLPKCSAIVHHGGIGTTSAALAAGIPQVIRPMAYDQFDNAQRVETLGCGVWLRRDKDLVSVLGDRLNRRALKHALSESSQRLQHAPHAATVAAIKIKSLLQDTGSR